MEQEFRFSKTITTLINIPLGGVFAIIQALFIIKGLSWFMLVVFANDNSVIFWLIYTSGAFICAFFTSTIGLLQLKWSAIILGAIAGLLSIIVLNGGFTLFRVFFFLSFTAFATYIFAMFPAIKFKKPKFINDLNIIIAGHILCDIIVMSSLLVSIRIEWIRPFVAAEVFLVLFGWYILGGCPFTVAEVKLNDNASKKLVQNGFLVYYGRSYFGIKVDELKFEKILDHIFYIATAIIFLLWIIYP